MNKKLKRPSKVQAASLRIALGMTGCIAVNDHTAELILVVIDELQRLGKDFSVRDAVSLALQVEKWNKTV